MKPVPFPSTLQPAVDALVAAAQSGQRKPGGPAFSSVTSWCEANEDESGLITGEHGSSFLAVELDAEVSRYSDEDFECDENVDDSTEITDAERVAFIRNRIVRLFDEAPNEADAYPMICDIRIRGSSGAVVSLCYEATDGGGMDRPQITWIGVYRTLAEYRKELRAEGTITSAAEARCLSDRVLLGALARKRGAKA